MNRLQLSKFKAALAMLPCAPASLSASSGTFLGRDYHFDLIRQGVALYGANPKRDLANPMQTVAVVNAKILQCRRIDKDESVGYAATFRAERPTMIATVALGYADGIPRSTSNKGQAAIGGVRVPIVGRVSMDLVTLDVTDLSPLPQAGQDVELLGDTITLEQAAKWAGTNAYEILTRLRRMPRHYLE